MNEVEPSIPDTAVVVSTWIGNPSDYLCSLVDSLKRYNAGAPMIFTFAPMANPIKRHRMF